jgi:hypothetical protein
MTGKDLLALEVQDDNTLAEWYCTLNMWDWPKGLPDPMTEEERKDYDLQTITIEEFNAQRCHQIMEWIENKVGKRLVSWTHNKESMTEDEFDLWWRGNYEGDKEAKRKSDERSWEKAGGKGPPPGYPGYTPQ